MFKPYVLYLKAVHFRDKLGGKLNVIAATLINIYLICASASARKIDFIEDIKHGEFKVFDPILILCLLMNFIALVSHLFYRKLEPGYLPKHNTSEEEGSLA
jgi:phosphate starvation-inducible membrane PsiE